MAILYTYGNMFDKEHEAYAQGVNTQGKMGAGIALAFKQKYPKMYTEYETLCKAGNLSLGDVYHYQIPAERPDVFNIATQDNLKQASINALEQGIKTMYDIALRNEIRDIAMPHVGVGHGNLRFEHLDQSLQQFRDSSDLHLTVYEFTTLND